jgi:hypothetical protein
MALVSVWSTFLVCIEKRACVPHPPRSSTLVRWLPTSHFFFANGSVVSEQVPLSIYVIADLDTEDGLSVIHAALAFIVRRMYPCFLLI